MGTAEAAYREGDVASALRLAVDEGDLRLAGLCAFELGELDEAVDFLRRAGAVVDLAHVLHAARRTGEALDALRAGPDDDAVLFALVALAESSGRIDEASRAAAALAARRPDDTRAVLDHAHLALECGRFAEAAGAFARLGVIDTDDGHRAFACHGRAEAWAHAGRWRAALDAALDAARSDRGQLTTDVLACVNARVFGDAGRHSPPWEAVASQLAAARHAHRRLHAETL